MKKIKQLALMSAIALTGVVGFTSCSSNEEAAITNPNYNPETNEVIAKFMFNVSSGNTPTYGDAQSAPRMEDITRQSSAATQATEDERFRGIDNAVLFTTHQGSDGKHLAAATTMEKRFDLSRIISAGAIDKTKSSRVIETSLPLNTNTLLFYGKAIEGSASAAEVEEGLTSYDLFGHLEEFNVAGDPDGLDISATNFELSPRINGNVTKFRKIEELLAGVLTCIMNTNLSGDNHVNLPAERYTFDVSTDEYPATLTWRDYAFPEDAAASGKSPVETSHVLYPLEIKLADAYREMTTIKQAEGELRAGYGTAILETIQDLWSVVNEVRCATPFSKAEAVAKYLAVRIHERIKEYFNGEVPSTGQQVTEVGFESTTNIIGHFASDNAWPASAGTKPTGFDLIKDQLFADFPHYSFHLASGAAHYLFDSDKKKFEYVQNYNTSAVGGDAAASFTVESYFYPAELVYFGNSALRASNSEYKASFYPQTVSAWDDDSQWPADWVKNTHVTAATQSVAMQNDINYGTSLLKTTVKYGAAKLKDNNHAIQKDKYPELVDDTNEPDNEITVNGTSFQLIGVLVGGQSKKVGWDFTPIATDNSMGYVYDYAIGNASSIPATGESNPNYTLLFDNYNAKAVADGKQQDKVYVALELVNNSGQDFYGLHNIIRNGGIFYLIGELDPEKSGLNTITWPTHHALPPYNADGTSKKIARVFMQDYMTSANFVIGENSLKHAYLTVPDLRYSSLTLGLSVDLHWSTGLNFGDVILGGN